jgi:ankyrin repeat protein
MNEEYIKNYIYHKDYDNALRSSCFYNNNLFFDLLIIRSDVNINAYNDKQKSALYWAASHLNYDMVYRLLERGAIVNFNIEPYKVNEKIYELLSMCRKLQ